MCMWSAVEVGGVPSPELLGMPARNGTSVSTGKVKRAVLDQYAEAQAHVRAAGGFQHAERLCGRRAAARRDRLELGRRRARHARQFIASAVVVGRAEKPVGVRFLAADADHGRLAVCGSSEKGPST